MRLKSYHSPFFEWNLIFTGWERIVMPRSFSRSMSSRSWSWNVLISTVWVWTRNLSARVDFPWSTWAMMEKFLICDKSSSCIGA